MHYMLLLLNLYTFFMNICGMRDIRDISDIRDVLRLFAIFAIIRGYPLFAADIRLLFTYIRIFAADIKNHYSQQLY